MSTQESSPEQKADTTRGYTSVKEAASGYWPKASDLSQYLAPLNRYVVLKERSLYDPLFERYHHGDETEHYRARDLLVYGNIRLVVSIALRYRNRGLELCDLMQEGVIGLMTAIEKFELDRGHAFSTYATQWIRQGMTRALMNSSEDEPVRVPGHARELQNLVGKVWSHLYLELGRFPREIEVYQRIKKLRLETKAPTTLANVKEAMQSLIAGGPIRLDQPMGSDEGSDTFANIVYHPPKTETVIEARRLYAEYREAVDRIEEEVTKLGPRTASIIRLRYGLGEFEAMTFEEVGERYELTRERVRQIAEQGMQKIEQAMGVTTQEFEQLINTMQELEVLANAI